MNKHVNIFIKQLDYSETIRRCLMLLIALVLVFNLNAQTNQDVSGIIVSATGGEPLVGASVIQKGTTNGTVTDLDGKFMIKVPGNATLEITYLGFKTISIAVANQKNLSIQMAEDNNVLEEVVAIGYGVQKKKLNTGATVQVKGDDVAKLNTTNPLQALQGKTPGVQIASTSGQPGADMKVTIRGLGTVGNAAPLYIIDGIEGDITLINASDIQSIDVLKDAASAAIYGAQAANGVVLITTKSGAKGKGQISFDAYFGVQKVARRTNMLNADEYKIIMNEQSINSGSSAYNWSNFGDMGNTEWLDYMFKDNTKTSNYALNINGGSENSVYSMSLNYTNQEGIVGGPKVSNYERYGFRINTEHKLYSNILKVGQHLNFNYVKNRGITVGNQYNNTLRGAFNTSPLSPVYSDNNLYDSPYNDTSSSLWYKGDSNPYGLMMTNSNNKNNAQKLMADIYAELEPVNNLKLRSTFGINYSSSDYRSFTPLYQFSSNIYNTDHTTVNQNMNKGQTLTWTNTAGYDFKINENHSFTSLVGAEIVRYDGSYLSGSNWNLLSQFNDFSHAYLVNTTGKAHLDDNGKIVHTKTADGGPNNKYRRISYFGRIGYNYAEKYMLNATLRADASSKFASGHRWGYFPSFSAGWNISNEEFMQSLVKELSIDQMKLRVSWGQVGNQNIDDFQYSAPINTVNGEYVFGTNKVNTQGAYPSRLSNKNIKWETSEQTNIGLDALFLESRLGVNFDFYVKTTKDWLVKAPILATAGAEAPYINGGDVKNRGVEMALSWRDKVGDVNYNISVNGAYNKNKVGNIPTEDGIIHGQTNMLFDNSEEFYRAQNGYAIGYFYGYKTAGIFQNEQEIADWKAAGNGILQSTVKPGDVKFVDLNHDGKIDASDKTNLGNGMPDFTYGFSFGLDYKGLDFSVTANGSVGNKIVQSYRNQTNFYGNYTTDILNRWTGEGTSNKIPRVTNANINWIFSDLYVHDGDFLRISNITLGYDLSRIIKLKAISQLRIYGSVQNAFTFTKYNGMDPEIGYGTDGWVSGIDLGYYPRPRTYLFGVNVKF